MSNTSRPLMGATIQQNPSTAYAKAPNEMLDPAANPADPTGQTGQPAQDAAPTAPEHNWEKRYKDLQSFHSRTVNDQTAEIARLKAQSTPQFQVPKTAEELSAFSKENPEVYAVIESIAHQRAQEQLASVNGELTQVKQSLEETAKEKALNDLQRAHPDFQEIDSSPEFHQWIAQQSVEVQGWIFNNPDDASKVNMALSLFKQNTGWGVQNNTNPTTPNVDQLEASRNVNVPSGGDTGTGDPRSHPQYIWKESEIGKMHPSEYAKFEGDIDLALAEGRVAIGR